MIDISTEGILFLGRGRETSIKKFGDLWLGGSLDDGSPVFLLRLRKGSLWGALPLDCA